LWLVRADKLIERLRAGVHATSARSWLIDALVAAR